MPSRWEKNYRVNLENVELEVPLRHIGYIYPVENVLQPWEGQKRESNLVNLSLASQQEI